MKKTIIASLFLILIGTELSAQSEAVFRSVAIPG